jgi:glucose-6-phosphate isomerase
MSREQQRILIDNAFAETIKPEDRLSRKDYDGLKPRLKDIQEGFKKEARSYETLVTNLRAWTKSHEQKEDIASVIAIAQDIRDTFKAEAFVTIGIGGSDLGGRTIHGVLNNSMHNVLDRAARGNAPQMYFVGDTFDPKELFELLEYLERTNILLKTIFNVISKSGTTSETIAAFLIIKERVGKVLKEEGRDPAEYANLIVATTGLNEKSALYSLNQRQNIKFRALLPVPDGVGGRFSFASPVGLLALAVSAHKDRETPRVRVENAVNGLCDAEALSYTDIMSPENIPFVLAAVNYCAEKKKKGSIVFYPYSKALKLIGDWFTQLNTESLQENGQGQNIIATTGPTGNHSIANGILGGPRDKFVVFVKVEQYDDAIDFVVPKKSGIGGELEVLEGKRMSFIQNASQQGTEINFTNNGVPNCVISIPRIDTYNLFKFLYFLEVSVAVEGELRGLGRMTYLQPGVEGYKIETKKILAKK